MSCPYCLNMRHISLCMYCGRRPADELLAEYQRSDFIGSLVTALRVLGRSQ